MFPNRYRLNNRDHCAASNVTTKKTNYEHMNKQTYLLAFMVLTQAALAQQNSTTTISFSDQKVIAAPANPREWEKFRQDLKTWRTTTQKKLNYNATYYTRPAFEWSSRAYSCYFLMLYDELIFDKTTGHYTPQKLLDYGNRFGGFDCVILWQAYPRIGIDPRNQFDFYKDMPGGLKALREMVNFFHQNNIKVMIDYNPWDTGTRRAALRDADALVEMVLALDADGVYLDTMNEAPAELRAKLDKAKPGVVFDSEGSTEIEKIPTHQSSWGQWFKDSYVPGVLRNKWYEPRHMVRLVERWDHDHSDEIQLAWLNGSGMVIWENVFGTWNGWNEHDKSMLRLMLPVQRKFYSAFIGDGWFPLVPTLKEHIFSHRWDAPSYSVWTVVNRNQKTIGGELIKVLHKKDFRYFNLFAGKEIAAPIDSDSIALSATIESRSLGGFIEIKKTNVTADFLAFLKEQGQRLAQFNSSTNFPTKNAVLQKPKSTALYKSSQWKGEMAEIKPAAGNQARELMVRECGFYEPQTDLQLSFPFLHTKAIFDIKTHVGHYAIDITPVTNAEFKRFVDAVSYRPADTTNFLKHWQHGRIPTGKENHPVVYVSLEDARAYAAWAGKRLPTEDEWQWAAIGQNYMGYPWGGPPDSLHCNMGKTGTTTPVKNFPAGRSAVGCYDMCGNVHEWTESERTDGRIRFCMLKGGSYYKATGSDWYAEGGPLPSHHSVKFLLMAPSIDRCATVGFRCVVDME